jgi:hypothetical protein
MNLSFLKKLKVLGPVALMLIPGAQPFAPLILGAIELAEHTGESGQDKRLIGRQAVELGADAANTAHPGAVDKEQAVAVYESTVDAVVKAVKLSGNIPVKK